MAGWVGGTFTRARDWTDDEAAGTNMLSANFDEEDDNFETGINSCLHKGGQNSPTADLPMGGKKHTGVGDASARDQYATVRQVQDGKFKYNTTAGSLNAYTLELSPAVASYTAGQEFTFKVNRTNTGKSTLNVNGAGAKNIWASGTVLSGSEMVIGRVYKVVYDGSVFHLISTGDTAAAFGGAKLTLSSSQILEADENFIVPFTEVVYDDEDKYYGGAGTYSFVIPADGRYRITYQIRHVATALTTGNWIASMLLSVNGTRAEGTRVTVCIIEEFRASPYYAPAVLNGCWEGTLEQNDTIKLSTSQSNTGDADIRIAGDAVYSNEHGRCYMAIQQIQ